MVKLTIMFFFSILLFFFFFLNDHKGSREGRWIEVQNNYTPYIYCNDIVDLTENIIFYLLCLASTFEKGFHFANASNYGGKNENSRL